MPTIFIPVRCSILHKLKSIIIKIGCAILTIVGTILGILMNIMIGIMIIDPPEGAGIVYWVVVSVTIPLVIFLDCVMGAILCELFNIRFDCVKEK